MNTSRIICSLAFSALVGTVGVARAAADTVVTSNFVVSKAECNMDVFGVALTFDKLATVDASGKYIYPKGSGIVLMACEAAPALQNCASKRGVFEIKTGGGIYTPPMATSFQCLP